MIEIVPSEHAREVLRGKREFTDFEKATLIWNSPIASFDEKIESLRELAGRTEDETLKKQIRERLEYEKKLLNYLLRMITSIILVQVGQRKKLEQYTEEFLMNILIQ